MTEAAEKVKGPFFSKLIPITKQAANHYKNAKLKQAHFKLLKKACLYDIGHKVIEECLANFLPSLREYIKIVAQKGRYKLFLMFCQKTWCVVCFRQGF